MKTIVVRSGEGLRVDAEVRSHAVIFDEPEDKNGTNLGPTPVEGVLASLGGCTAITLRLYADRKGWPLGKVAIKVTGEPPVAGDKTGQWSITQHVHLEGDLDEEQYARLMDIAGRCPVHRMLEHGASFTETAWNGEA